jgi:hypothetical protein
MMPTHSRFIALWLVVLALPGCSRETADPNRFGSAVTRLTELKTPLPDGALRRRVYVPVYSSIYLGQDITYNMMDLTATVSVRNVSTQHPLVLLSARYYDSSGKQIREYVNTASELAALATVEFVVARKDSAGGPGANFLVEWSGPSDIDEPIIEAVMIGRSGSAGYSFTSAGRPVKGAPPH